MHISRSIILSGLALGALTLGAVRPAHAVDFTFIVSNPNITAAPGDSSSIDGTITYTSTPDVSSTTFTSPTFSGGALSADEFDPGFFSFFGSPITAGSSYTGAILDFTLSPTDTPGEAVTDGSTGFTIGDFSGSITDPVSITAEVAAPEPSSVSVFAVAAAGLAGLLLTARRRKASVRA